MWQHDLDRAGFAFVPAAQFQQALGPTPDWAAFAASWDHLALDTHMADGGRYRRRRHAVFHASEAGLIRQPHQPHFQARDDNPLNGGIDRWFEPMADSAAHSLTLARVLAFCQATFGARSPHVRTWRVELHPFRIEARADAPGLPTPEGMHRDGVDWVLVLLIARRNVERGETRVADADGRPLGSFTLVEPFDAVLVDDHRVRHGVTAIAPIDPNQPAYRDVLVVTLTAR